MDIPAWFSTMTPGGVLLLAIVLILTGKLLPESMHNKIIGTEKEARSAAELRAERAEAQVDKLTDTLETHTRLLESIRDTAREVQG